MDKQDIAIEIYYELDTIHLWSRMATFAAENDMEKFNESDYDLIFKDIEKRCWQISGKVEQLAPLFPPKEG